MVAGKVDRAARAAKAAQLRRAQEARERRRRLAVFGSVSAVVVVLVVATIVVIVRESSGQSLAAVTSTTQEAGHTTSPVTYAQNPPAGGRHDPTWLNCGVYDKPVRNENAVHDLEHGAVWITYRPDLPADQVARLKQFATGQTYLDLSPYPGLDAPVVVSAWGKQLRLSGPDDPRLPQFVRTYRQGSSAPESGAACTGGTGTPSS